MPVAGSLRFATARRRLDHAALSEGHCTVSNSSPAPFQPSIRHWPASTQRPELPSLQAQERDCFKSTAASAVGLLGLQRRGQCHSQQSQQQREFHLTREFFYSGLARGFSSVNYKPLTGEGITAPANSFSSRRTQQPPALPLGSRQQQQIKGYPPGLDHRAAPIETALQAERFLTFHRFTAVLLEANARALGSPLRAGNCNAAARSSWVNCTCIARACIKICRGG